jgi:hemerythrin-like domain-containing protein
MADIDNLLRQHRDILNLADKIVNYGTDRQIADHAFDISMLLSQLAGKLKIHTTTEDQFLYPSLLKHDNQKVRTVSKCFLDEMGGLAAAFEKYKVTYFNAKQITASPAKFAADSRMIIEALTERIAKENTELYPLIK